MKVYWLDVVMHAVTVLPEWQGLDDASFVNGTGNVGNTSPGGSRVSSPVPWTQIVPPPSEAGPRSASRSRLSRAQTQPSPLQL